MSSRTAPIVPISANPNAKLEDDADYTTVYKPACGDTPDGIVREGAISQPSILP